MKGTLLLLALLVIGELGFQTTEACIPYYEAYTAVVLGSKTILNILLSKFDPTAQERAAVEKVQECFNEAGLKGKLLDVLVLHYITDSTECQHYYSTEIRAKIRELFSKLMV